MCSTWPPLRLFILRRNTGELLELGARKIAFFERNEVHSGIRSRKMQSLGYSGPLILSAYLRFQWIRDTLKVLTPLP